MGKSKLIFLLVCLFLVHSQVDAIVDIRTSPLTPATKVSPTNTDIKQIFARKFNILAFAINLYRLDAVERLPKESIKEKLNPNFGVWKELGIAFDLDNIDFRKKGFTRYYPFTVNKKSFIIRIFDMTEEHYLPDFEVFHEGAFDGSKIGFQIIPDINTILKDAKIRKASFPDPTLCSTCP